MHIFDKTRTFEEKLERIKDVVSRLERGNLSLEESMALFKEGAALVKDCQQYLEKTDMEIKKLIGGSIEDFRE